MLKVVVHHTNTRQFIFFGFWLVFGRHSEVIVAVVVGFSEDRMMDIITGRAPPPARAEAY